MTLELPRIALGCGNFGGIGSAPELFGQGIGLDQALELMDAAWQLGITHFDTADAYGGGRSEAAIGRWIASRAARPTITTKTFHPMQKGADSGLAPDRIRSQFRSSLERLGVEHVELYLAHDFDPGVPLGETFGAFEQLMDDESVRAYGVSNFDAAQLREALGAGRPGAVQNGYNLLQREDRSQMLPLCEERQVAYLAFGPLAGGWLTGKYHQGEPFPEGSRMTQRPEPYMRLLDPETFALLEQLEQFAHELERSMTALALGWLLADPRVAQIVVGPGRPEHLEAVRDALAHPLTADEVGHIEELLC